MTVDASSRVSIPLVESSAPRFPWSRAAEAVLLVSLVLFMLLAALFALRYESPMQDEVVHVPAGVSYWQQHDARLNLEHPLLLKLLAAAPVLLLHPQANYRDPSWAEAERDYEGQWIFGNRFFSVWNQNVPRLILWARVPMLLVGLLLAGLVWTMGRRLGGRWGGLLSLLVFVTSPYFLSNSAIVTTDIGVTLFVLWSGWLLASLWNDPRPKLGIGLGLTLAGAFLSKYSAGLLLPAIVIAWIWLSAAERRQRGPYRFAPLERRRRRMLALAVVTAMGAGYLLCLPFMWNTPVLRVVSLGPEHGGRLRGWLATLQRLLDHHPGWTHLLMPPLLYLHGVGSTLIGLRRPVFLLGHHYAQGQWFYFPVLMFYKMAPAFLVLLLLFLLLLIGRWRRERETVRGSRLDEISPGHGNHLRVLLVLLLVFGGTALASHLNIGLRHFSIPIALLMVLVACLEPLVTAMRPVARRAVAVACLILGLSCLFTGLTAFPYYLAYFNLFRGNRPAWQIAADSNLDWGQSLPALRAFMKEHGIGFIALDTFGSLNRSVYIPHYHQWRCERTRTLPEEWDAVSAGQLAAFTDPPSSCDWLFAYPHWALAGNSMFVFHRVSESTGVKGEQRDINVQNRYRGIPAGIPEK